MAVTNYLQLRATICDTANKDDISDDVSAFEGTTIDSVVARCVERATMRIQRDLVSRGGHKNMETVNSSIVTVGGQEYVDFPVDFAGNRAFMLTTSQLVVLTFVDPTSLWTQYPSPATGQPQKFSIIGTNRAYLRPIPDGVYATRLVYYQAIPPLSADTDTNWVLLNHWDIYEAAAMLELCLVLEDDERIQYWQGIYGQKMNDLMGDDRNVRWAGVPTIPTINVAIA